MLTIGSLFSGIGGLELGLEWAGLGPVLWQVEIDPNARAVLAHHWPEVTRHEDVRTVGAATLAPVDLICGGFPCQDVSSAGKRAGLDGARSGLWFEFRRVVSELLPRWVVVENVAGGADRWLDAVCAGLAELGYSCLSVPLAAADVGAPHLRSRVFIVAAYAHGNRQPVVAEHAEVASASAVVADADEESSDAGFDARSQRAGRTAFARSGADDAADVGCARREGARPDAQQERRGPPASHWRSPEPDMVRVVHGLPRKLDGARARIAALGNAVVPQCAEVVGWVIRELCASEAA